MPARPEEQPRLSFAGVTDVGRQRKHNEDCLLIRGELDLFCVADGMGGHNAGDVASKLVTTSLGNYFEATVDGSAPHELPADYASLPPGARRLAAGVAKANRDVHTISNTVQQHHGMGSTCVAIHLSDGMAHIAHVGDSRCYRIRDGEIKQMTRDHSLINDALDMKPDLTREELARLPKNIITRALGMKDIVKVDVKSEIALPGDIYLLCSDGLTGMVPVDEILDVINLTPEPREACELLVAEANDHGGTDNISALLVMVEGPASEATGAAEIDVSGHAEVDADEIEREEIEAAELAADRREPPTPVDLEEIPEPTESVEIDAPPSSERITYPSAPVALRAFSVPPEARTSSEPPAPQHASAPPAALAPAAAAAIPPLNPAPVVMEATASATMPHAQELLSRSFTPVGVKRGAILEIVDEAAPVDRGAPSARTPQLEVVEEAGAVEDLVSPEEAAALAAGGEIDLDVRGPWPGKQATHRCPVCRFELYPGNRFCVECGTRIDAPASGLAGEP